MHTAAPFLPASIEQQQAKDAFAKSDLLIVTGPAGSGKTHVAVTCAVEQLGSRKARRIVLSRPAVNAGGEDLGFLPGDIGRKMLPFLLPFHDVLRNQIEAKPEEWIKQHVEICPISFMRGRSFDHSIAILDEAQNCTYEQLRLFVTRIGRKSKLIITGDETQCDRRDSGLAAFVARLGFGGLPPGVAHVRLPRDTSPRHPLLPVLLERLG